MASPLPRRARRGFDDFGACLVLHMALPLVPVAIDSLIRGQFGHGSLFLALSMYALSLGVASTYKTSLAVSLMVGVLAAVAVGFADHKALSDADVQTGWRALGLLFLAHAVERFHRHVILKERFFEFGGP